MPLLPPRLNFSGTSEPGWKVFTAGKLDTGEKNPVQLHCADVTVTVRVAVTVAPSSSVALTVTVNVPAEAQAWLPVHPVVTLPSPQATEHDTVSPPTSAVDAVSWSVAPAPTVVLVVGWVIVTVGATLVTTTSLAASAEAVPSETMTVT